MKIIIKITRDQSKIGNFFRVRFKNLDAYIKDRIKNFKTLFKKLIKLIKMAEEKSELTLFMEENKMSEEDVLKKIRPEETPMEKLKRKLKASEDQIAKLEAEKSEEAEESEEEESEEEEKEEPKSKETKITEEIIAKLIDDKIIEALKVKRKTPPKKGEHTKKAPVIKKNDYEVDV